MLPLVPYIISKNLYRKSPDAAMMSFAMTATQCLYIPYVHDSTMLRDLIDAPTTSQHVFSVCARTFVEIDHDATKSVIDMQSTTPRSWHILIL
jgi:hypothetical protein